MMFTSVRKMREACTIIHVMYVHLSILFWTHTMQAKVCRTYRIAKAIVARTHPMTSMWLLILLLWVFHQVLSPPTERIRYLWLGFTGSLVKKWCSSLAQRPLPLFRWGSSPVPLQSFYLTLTIKWTCMLCSYSPHLSHSLLTKCRK